MTAVCGRSWPAHGHGTSCQNQADLHNSRLFLELIVEVAVIGLLVRIWENRARNRCSMVSPSPRR
jgi:hypothetical protein